MMIDQLPEDWARDVDDDTLEFLHDEGRVRVAEQRRSAMEQERTAITLTAWGIVAIGASGLFGDLRFGFADDPIVTSLSILALAAFAGVFAAAIRLVWPRNWAIESDIEWLAAYAYQGADRRDLMIEAVSMLIAGFRQNQRNIERRDRLMPWLSALVVIEVGLVVAIQLAALAAS